MARILSPHIPYPPPDFVIENTVGMLELIEVKFRKNGTYNKSDYDRLRKYDGFWKPTVIVLAFNPEYFIGEMRVIKPPYFDKTNRINDDGKVLEQELWGIKPEVYSECINLINTFSPFFIDVLDLYIKDNERTQVGK